MQHVHIFYLPKTQHHSSLGTFSFKLGYISLENLITCLKLCCHRQLTTASVSVPILVNPTGDRALWPEEWSCDPQESSHHCDLCPARWRRHSGGTTESPNGNGRSSWTHLTGLCVMCRVGNKVTCLVLMLACFCQVIKSVVPAKYLDSKTVYHLQPSGRFVIGGPQVIITHWGKNNKAN